MDSQTRAPDTSQISDWRSIVTLIVFIITNVVVSFPFHIPIPIPRALWRAFMGGMHALRIYSRPEESDAKSGGAWMFLRFHVSTVMAPLYACLFLAAILALGRTEIYDGTIGANNIEPYDVMIFFITLAYVALSIDASGLLRYLAFRVLQKGGGHGRRLFLYLYWFFFALGTAIGNDPIVLSGTAFLAYMIRGSSNIASARAWVFSQFAVANISSAILVSSNPTNLVLAGAFQIRFIDYTANMVVPVLFTAAILFPCLLFLVFRDEKLIPRAINIHELPDADRNREPVNPNVPFAGVGENRSPIAEILIPFLDRRQAIISCIIMGATLLSVLLINAITASQGGHSTPVIYVTVPAAVLCFTSDLIMGWHNRHATRAQASRGRMLAERIAVGDSLREAAAVGNGHEDAQDHAQDQDNDDMSTMEKPPLGTSDEEFEAAITRAIEERRAQEAREPVTLATKLRSAYIWWRETFPAASTVISRLPFPLVPFAFSMFVLVQGLVTKGWVAVFGYGWNAWVDRTGVVGAIGGMAFLGVVLSNFTGTNIGTTILLCRIIQAWEQILASEGRTVSQRTFWGAVYSMALGVNYGAFSSVLCASLAGLLWHNILLSKGVVVRRLEFFRVNVPIIGIATAVGCAVLVGQIYITRSERAYS